MLINFKKEFDIFYKIGAKIRYFKKVSPNSFK
jgi:hypothetical protein